MKRSVVRIAPAAERDIADGFLWYLERNALAANAFRAGVFDAIDRIAETPLGCAADVDGNRRRMLRRFPYSVVYEMQVRLRRRVPFRLDRHLRPGEAKGF